LKAVNVSSEALVREASLLSRQGRVGEAIDAYQRVLARWPALPDTWYNLAVQLRKAGRHAQALTAYQQALERG
jgi:tetratricopeptide (TPR) repeat protein